MKKIMQRFLRAAIPVFCLWHMAAIAAYNLPDNRSRWMSALHTLSAPYVLSLSQWQKWDMFSPDPQRRSVLYRLEVVDATGALIVKRIDAEHTPWTLRAKELKVLQRLEADFGKAMPRYVSLYCDEIPEAAGKDLRLVAEVTMLPDTLDALRHTAEHTLPVSAQALMTVHCSPAS